MGVGGGIFHTGHVEVSSPRWIIAVEVGVAGVVHGIRTGLLVKSMRNHDGAICPCNSNVSEQGDPCVLVIVLTLKLTCSEAGNSDMPRCPLRSPVSRETRAMAASDLSGSTQSIDLLIRA